MTISPYRSNSPASGPIFGPCSSLRVPIFLLIIGLLAAWSPAQNTGEKPAKEKETGPQSLLAVKLAGRSVPTTSKQAQELQARIEQGVAEAEAMPEGDTKKALLEALSEQLTAVSSLRANLEQLLPEQQDAQRKVLEEELSSVQKEAAKRANAVKDPKSAQAAEPSKLDETVSPEELEELQKSTESKAAALGAKLDVAKNLVKQATSRLATLKESSDGLTTSLASREATAISLRNELKTVSAQVIALEALPDEPANLRPLREAAFAKMLKLSNLETGVIADRSKGTTIWPLEIQIAEAKLAAEQATVEALTVESKLVSELQQRISARRKKKAGKDAKSLTNTLENAKAWRRPLLQVQIDTKQIDENKEAIKATASHWHNRFASGDLAAEIRAGNDIIELTANDEDGEFDAGFESTDDLRALHLEQGQRLELIKKAFDELTAAKNEARRTLRRETRLKLQTAAQRQKSDYESAWEAAPPAAKGTSQSDPGAGGLPHEELRPETWRLAFEDYKGALKSWQDELEKFSKEATQNRLKLQSSAEAIEKSVASLTAQLLWAREESSISTASISEAFSDAPALPLALWSRVTHTVAEWKDALFSEANRTLVFATIAFVVFLVILLLYVHNRLPATISWMESREGDDAGILKVVAAGIRRSELAFGVALGYAGVCAIWGVEPWNNGMVAVVFLAPFAYRFLRVLLDVLLHPSHVKNRVIDVDDELAFELHRAGRWIINVTLLFVPAGILMDTAGYAHTNRGFVSLWWFLYALSFVVIFLTVARPSLLKRFVSGQGQFATSVRTFAYIAYPLVVGALLFLLVLHSLRYAEATKFFRERFGITLLLVLAAFLVYRGLLRRFLPERDFERKVSRDDFDQAEEYHAAGRKLFLDLFIRMGIRLLVLVPLLIFLSGTWRKMDWSFLNASLVGESGTLTVSSFVWGIGTMWVFVALLAHYRRAMQFIILPGTRLDHGLQYAVLTLSSYAIFALGLVISLNILRVQGDQIAFVLSALMVGIGFGLKDIVTNFISGIMLLVERPLKVGDQVMIGSDLGTVEKINLRSTTIMTFDNVGIVVPNGDLITGKLINRSTGSPLLRTTVDFGVDYEADVRAVLKIADEVLGNHGQILKKPAPIVYFVGLGDSSLDFSMMFWASMSDNRMRIAGDIRAALISRFRKQGIEIPFPQRDLHVRSVDEKVMLGLAPNVAHEVSARAIAEIGASEPPPMTEEGASPGASGSEADAQREAAGKPELADGKKTPPTKTNPGRDETRPKTKPKAT